MSAEPTTNDDVAARLAALQAEIDQLKAEARIKPEAKDAGSARRQLITGLLGGAAAAAVLGQAGEARADISPGDLNEQFTNALNDLGIPQNLDSISTSAGATVDILGQAMSVLGQLGVPPQLMQLLRCVIGGGPSFGFNFDLCSALQGVIGGPHSMLGTGNISSAMDAVWPADPATVSDGMDEGTIVQYEAIREQVTGSQATTATLAEGQQMLGEIDVATVGAIDAAAQGGSLITVLALLGHMILGTNIRLSNIVQSLNASQQSHGSNVLINQHDRYLSVLDRHRRREATMVSVGGANTLGSGGGGGGILTSVTGQ